MRKNDKMTFSDCLKVTKNILLTGDSNTEFQYSKDTQDENTDLKNSIKSQHIYLVGIFALLFLIFMIITAICITNIMADKEIPTHLIQAVWWIGCLCIFGVGFKYITVIRKNKKEYDTNIVENAIHSIIPNATIQFEECINPQKLYNMGVLPDFTSANGSYLISYQKNGKTNYFSNLCLDYDFSLGADGGKIKTTFVGQAYVLNFKELISGQVRIIATTGNGALSWFRKQRKDESKIETENALFNKNFAVFTTNEQVAFYVLTPYVMEQLLALKNKYGIFGVTVAENEIVIALSTGYALFAMPHNYHDIEQISVENSMKNLQEVLRLAQGIEDSINGRIRS